MPQNDNSKNHELIHAAGYGDACFVEDVGDFGFAEARGVVFEGEKAFGFVHAKAAEAVGVCEFAEGAELIVAEWRLQFKGRFEKCHTGNYSRRSEGRKKDNAETQSARRSAGKEQKRRRGEKEKRRKGERRRDEMRNG